MSSSGRDRAATAEQALLAAGQEAEDLRTLLAAAVAAAQRAEERASALTELAHELSGVEDTRAVTELLAAALPRILDCDASAVWLWNPELGEVRAAATCGLSQDLHELLLAMPVRPEETPELAVLLATRSPLVLNAGSVTPVLEQMLAALGLRAAIGVALLSGARLFGAVTASWSERPLEGPALIEATARLQGVADHAATALQNARLLEDVRHQALHDALTGLPNRVLFQDRLDKAVQAARRGGGAAVLFGDLDRFKEINDEHGHGAGDEVLRQVATRLVDAVRPGDTVARLSGDEFAVLLPDVADRSLAVDVAERITACFEQPVRVNGRPLGVTMSVGVALHAGVVDDGDLLLQLADAAMYVAKRRGRNQIALAGAAPGDGLQPDGPFWADSQRPPEPDELRMHLQPVVAFDGTGPHRLVGAEALVRWEHPHLGLIGPAAFVPTAERTGAIVEIDLWILREACREASTWPDGPDGPAHVAVNLSTRTLGDPRLHEAVRTALVDARLPPSRLHLELVESRALLDLPRVVERLVALRHLGVRVALDDFGTGFSTLSWLHELPVDRIKVDRTFIRDLASTGDQRRRSTSAALLRGIVAVGRELDVEVLAEGIESTEQLDAVRRAGCQLGQGYLFGRPAPPEQMRARLPVS